MAMSKAKQARMEAHSKKRREVFDIFSGKLNGTLLNGCDGPTKNSSLEWWVVGNQLVIVQIWADGSGWEYYLAGREGNIEKIVEQINALR